MLDYIKFKIKFSIQAFTLIEMIITMALMAILLGMAITKFSRKPSKDIIDEATMLINGAINEISAESLNIDTVKDLCSVTSGTGSNRASCNYTATAGTTGFTWDNMNNSKFSNQVIVMIQDTNNNFITQLSYQRGLISSIRYLNASTNIDINTSTEATISPININVQLKSDPANCYNLIKLWPNNVIDVVEHCARADGTN